VIENHALIRVEFERERSVIADQTAVIGCQTFLLRPDAPAGAQTFAGSSNGVATVDPACNEYISSTIVGAMSITFSAQRP
jgi:hypothetical protein